MRCLVASLVLSLFLLTACTGHTDDAAQGVQSVMEMQQAAWNRGDIDAFMEGYDRADSTTFVSGDEITHGWQTVLDRYKRRYSSREQMGMLTFSELEVKPWNSDLAIVTGRWKLTLADNSPHGRF